MSDAAKKETESHLKEVPPVEPAPENPIEASAPHAVMGSGNISMIMDIPLKLTAELGRTKIVVSELLNLGQGSVIELNKLAGEAMEIYINDKLIAKGEAVVVNDKFGVRLTDIISPKERVEQLK